jgi:hypothetical protein
VNRPHLERPRDVAITDFHVVMLPDGVLTDRSGRTYLTYARGRYAPSRDTPFFEAVPGPGRRLAACALFTFCGSAALAAIWFAFFVPCSCAEPPWTAAQSTPAISARQRIETSFAALRAPGMSDLGRMP